MELSDYIRILRKNWLVIVVTTLVGVAMAAGYSLTRTPQFEATSGVFVFREVTERLATKPSTGPPCRCASGR